MFETSCNDVFEDFADYLKQLQGNLALGKRCDDEDYTTAIMSYLNKGSKVLSPIVTPFINLLSIVLICFKLHFLSFLIDLNKKGSLVPLEFAKRMALAKEYLFTAEEAVLYDKYAGNEYVTDVISNIDSILEEFTVASSEVFFSSFAFVLRTLPRERNSNLYLREVF